MLQNTQTKQQKSVNEEKKFYRIGYWSTYFKHENNKFVDQTGQLRIALYWSFKSLSLNLDNLTLLSPIRLLEQSRILEQGS
jgi:hypothetical protein